VDMPTPLLPEGPPDIEFGWSLWERGVGKA